MKTTLKTADGTINLPITFNGKTQVFTNIVGPNSNQFFDIRNGFLEPIKLVCSQVDEVLEQGDTIDLAIDLTSNVFKARYSRSTDLSYPHLIEHKIDTGDTAPFKL